MMRMMLPSMTKKKSNLKYLLAVAALATALPVVLPSTLALAAKTSMHAALAAPVSPVPAQQPQPGAGGAGLFGGGSTQNGPVNRGPIERVANGKVTNKADAPISGAVVYLKDSKVLSVKTFITGADGVFHFGQLGQNTDYELWAEFNGARSKSKTISSFDDKNSYYFSLKVDGGK
jgi:hypothetical protein